jgi:hypothetical protein
MRLLCCSVMLVSLCSCNSNEYGDHPPYPASGKVLINGQPVKGLRVTLFPQSFSSERTIMPLGFTREDGSFDLSTYGPNDGAPAGDYRVTVYWPAFHRPRQKAPDLLADRYSKPESSPLMTHVDKGNNVLKTIEIEIDPDIIKKIESEALNESSPTKKPGLP